MKFGDTCKHIGFLDEGAIFMYIGPSKKDRPTDSGWPWVLVLDEGDGLNWYTGQIGKANPSLELVE